MQAAQVLQGCHPRPGRAEEHLLAALGWRGDQVSHCCVTWGGIDVSDYSFFLCEMVCGLVPAHPTYPAWVTSIWH